MIHAHIMNLTEPGCYERVLNSTFTANNLPNIKIPEAPDSRKLIKIMTQEEENMNDDDTNKQTQEKKRNDGTENTKQEQDKVSVQQESEETTIHQRSRNAKINSKDIQLKIYTPVSAGWPDHLSSRVLVTSLNENKFKYTYTDHTIEDTELLNIIETNGITIDRTCWNIVDNDVFRKIRSGLIAEKTPPPKDTSRRQRKYSK